MSEARLLAGPDLRTGAESLASHRARLGPMPRRHAQSVIDDLHASGLRGRGGAAFPVGRKWQTVATRPRGGAVVLVNGAEGEPLSIKDRALMALRPHLVLDGAFAAADAVGADDIVLYVGEQHQAAAAALRYALAERMPELRHTIRLAQAPNAYVAGEETAAVHFVNAGDARPTTTPPRPFERGVDGKATLVQNVESVALAGLIARFGADWYRRAGHGPARGTALVTVPRGPAGQVALREVDLGTPLANLATEAGASHAATQAVLLGGYFGAWIPTHEAWALTLDPESLRAAGRSMGAGVVSFLGTRQCGVIETARILRFMADQSARQCGPCEFGLGAIAEATDRVALGRSYSDDLHNLERWAGIIRGRGACRHPDGAVGMLASAMTTFGHEFGLHHHHRQCSARPATADQAPRVASWAA